MARVLSLYVETNTFVQRLDPWSSFCTSRCSLNILRYPAL